MYKKLFNLKNLLNKNIFKQAVITPDTPEDYEYLEEAEDFVKKHKNDQTKLSNDLKKNIKLLYEYLEDYILVEGNDPNSITNNELKSIVLSIIKKTSLPTSKDIGKEMRIWLDQHATDNVFIPPYFINEENKNQFFSIVEMYKSNKHVIMNRNI
jgi:ABC-type glycerol-3-phosphate transport system substrate-binding protein